MSRLIVKGLPPYLTEARLREHFAQKGAVTDAKLMKRPDGTSRRFGFVGYRSDDEAQAVCAFFDKTYIDTARINVSMAKHINDETLQKRRSQQEEPAEVPQRREKKGKGISAGAKHASFDEFLSVMAPKLKRKSWQNNEDFDQIATPAPTETVPAKKLKKAAKHEAAQPAAPSDEAAKDDTLSDLDYLRRRMRHSVTGGEKTRAFEQSDSEEEEQEDVEFAAAQARRKAQLEEEQRKDEENVDTIMQSGRLFVRNLPFSATEEELEHFFAGFGAVNQVHISLDPHSKASKGLAFVTFDDPAHALVAYRARDGAIFQGRLLHVLPAVDLQPKPQSSATLKQKRHEARRTTSGRDFNWSMLYMNSDAVATSISDQLGIPKTDILTSDEAGASPAVRLALAETRVIQDTKQFFEENGMQLEHLHDVRERSDDTILVKNIPYGTSGEELRALFAHFGDVGRVLIPPSNTIAVVEMPIVGEARAAFRGLAYKRFKDSVLYLEKAPAAFLPKAGAGKHETISAVQGIRAPDSSRTLLDTPATADAGTTLFVKNLSFSTTSARLADAFRGMDDFVFARVQTKPDPKVLGRTLSMGYGFVGFRVLDSAKQAQKAMNNYVLDGHTLAVSFTKRGHDADDSKPQRAPSAKMLVKNVPFEATKKDLRALFGAYGQLKSVRLPRQVHGRTRGFGFVEFVSRREAENAMAALRHTHLLGRHLVLEWSGDDDTDGVDALREKTRKAYVTDAHRTAVTGQRQKIRMGTQQIADAVATSRASEDEEEKE
ncbi:Multiple RNA-binding domain-containing protein 1 [Malassezia vespertilionis]|uniref:Multiple RNA-binding domain-containing protein 1 n=1 Tax=Malassezia vespertilionis TaxID=2020962 RepID=A0A2N1J8W1_9BASI|nr:Multiple RNA-binding domain-containing protein 1 [Malassezia vespertilionis]PKI83001.1 Mrd1p [Malassezia vespertilionis]WFD07812.1 Multiple RNA-binding domain-containing protein 1 [Malassezia vespertilionis]